MINLLYGITSAGFATGAYMFYIFRKRSGDRIFLFFCLSFCIMAVNQILFVMTASADGNHIWIYVARLTAYLLIIAGIFDKNREVIFSKK